MLPQSPDRQPWPCRTQRAHLHEVFGVFMKQRSHPQLWRLTRSSWNVSWQDVVPSGSTVPAHVGCRPDLSEKTEKWVSSRLNIISLGRFDPHFTRKTPGGHFYPAAALFSRNIWNPNIIEAGNHLTSWNVSTCCRSPISPDSVIHCKTKRGFVTPVCTLDSLSLAVLSSFPHLLWFSDVLHQLKIVQTS